LFRLITGQEQADEGTIRIGETVVLGYVDQSRDALDGRKSVWQEISESRDEIELGKRKLSSRAYVAQFNFRGADQQKKVADLSGGERNRVHLAKMLKAGANVLLLDEPTNDLDVDTLRALEDALVAFAGCAVVISHDRWFLDRIATHISTASPRICWPSKATVMWSGLKATTRTMRRTAKGVLAPRRKCPIASSTSVSAADISRTGKQKRRGIFRAVCVLWIWMFAPIWGFRLPPPAASDVPAGR
jgi:ATPase subunit of ABC transporter with duplicated ATPase domains